jgi:hypothetical protein
MYCKDVLLLGFGVMLDVCDCFVFDLIIGFIFVAFLLLFRFCLFIYFIVVVLGEQAARFGGWQNASDSDSSENGDEENEEDEREEGPGEELDEQVKQKNNKRATFEVDALDQFTHL